MTPSTTRAKRRWLLGSALAMLLVAIAWQVLERSLAVDRYRQRVEQQLARVTGLPVSIGRLDLALRPVPCLSAVDFVIGEGDFRAVGTRLDLYPVLHKLLLRRVEISSIDLLGLSLALPAEPERLRARWSETLEHIRARSQDDPGKRNLIERWLVHRLTAKDASLRFGSEEVLASVSADGISSEVAQIKVEAAVAGRTSLVGAIELRDSGWRVRDLRIRGVQSDAVLDVKVERGRLQGRLAGANLDLDLARELRSRILAFIPKGRGESTISGSVDVALDRLLVGRSEARNLRTELRFEKDGVHLRNLELDTYEGRVTGSVDFFARTSGPWQRELKLEFAQVSGRFLDDLVFDEPRGIRGQFSGTLQFSAPLYDDVKAALAEGNGQLRCSARDGSFSRLGLATKLTTVLRSTEALRLRLPTLQDEGLVFDTVDASLAMEQGRLRIESFRLESATYSITATGEVDFREDRSHVPIEVNAIKGLTPFVERIPVAGDVLQIVNVRLVAEGSPVDMKIRIASVQDQILGAAMVGPRAVIKGIGDALRLLRGGSSAETPAQPAPEAPDAPGPS